MTLIQHRMSYGLLAVCITLNVILCYAFGWYTLLCAIWYSAFAVIYTMGSTTFKTLVPYAFMSYAFALMANSWYVRDVVWGTILTVLMISIAYLAISLLAEWINHKQPESSKKERA